MSVFVKHNIEITSSIIGHIYKSPWKISIFFSIVRMAQNVACGAEKALADEVVTYGVIPFR